MSPPGATELRLVVIDDHDLVREGLRSILTDQEGIRVVGTAGSEQDALDVVEATAPDVVLLDLRLGATSGAEVARRLRTNGSSVRILVLSAHDAPADLREALRAGADGYILKSSHVGELVDAVRRAHAGETVISADFVPKLVAQMRSGGPTDVTLTPRERQVLETVSGGLSNRAVAQQLGMSARTAQKHMENLFKKFGVHDRRDLVERARDLGHMS
jgi:DNA-binding NarL/FixJ family response regulator